MNDKRISWTEEETNFLKLNYENNGVDFICETIKTHTRGSIRRKANILGLKYYKENRGYNESSVIEAVKDSFSFQEVIRKLGKTSSGTTHKYLKKFIEDNGISTEHFDPWKNNRIITSSNIQPLEFWLQIGTSINSSGLKRKLYNAGIKKRECELCGQGEKWMEKQMSLILDHINGNPTDNRLENLRIVCPNCAATLETHCLGHKRNKK